MTALLGVLLHPRVLAKAGVLAVIWLGWSHYTGLRDDLAAARQGLATAVIERDKALDLADQNRAAFEREQEAKRAAVFALVHMTNWNRPATRHARTTRSSGLQTATTAKSHPPLRTSSIAGSEAEMTMTSPWPVCMRALVAMGAVLALALLAGCATPKERVVEKVVPQRVEIPASLLACAPEPVIRQALKSQREVALFVNRLAEAGADCRTKLAAVRRIVDSQ
jgi:hypothetical protein